MAVKLQAPANASSVSHGGEEYEVKDGTVIVPDGAAKVLIAGHGYVPAVNPEDEEVITDEDLNDDGVDEMTKKELIEELRGKGVSIAKGTTVGELRVIVRKERAEHKE